MSPPACRGCGATLPAPFLSLGAMPPANAYLRAEDLNRPEPRYPLDVRYCPVCHLVQVDPLVAPAELFGDYAYFSSYSTSWIEHARRFAADATARLGLGPTSRVVEIASNDGYLLRHFVASGVPALGIEPAANVAAAAVASGVPTEVRFFGREAAEDLVARGLAADLVVANNVLAHVPDLHDFAAGLARLVKPAGRISVEFPHLLNLIAETQFDTIYHEHFSYFSLLALLPALARHGLAAIEVERLPTHGGSLRLWLARGDGAAASARPAATVEAVLAAERAAGLDRAQTYAAFAQRVARCRESLRAFLSTARAEGRTVVAYGAAAKGNTLLNHCGIGPAEIAFVVDRNPIKQGRFLPGSRIPIRDPGAVAAARPDYLLILPWNLADEIVGQMAEIRRWGGPFRRAGSRDPPAAVTVPASRVLVTGASGLVGRHVLAPLTRLGFEVHATARRPLAGSPGVLWHAADLLDPTDRGALMAAARPSHMLHLAWATGTGSVWEDPANRDWAAASLDLAHRFAAAGGRRWVGVGTCAEYDWSAETLATPCREETTPCRPASLYGQSKYQTLQSSRKLLSSSSTTFAWARLFHLYGPGEDRRRLVPYVICALAQGRPAECTDGTQLRDLLYAGDAGEALARLVASDVASAINLGSGRPVRLAEVVGEIGRQMGRPELIRLGARPRAADDPAVLLPDLERQTRLLGWTAPTGLAQGIALTRAWWEAVA